MNLGYKSNEKATEGFITRYKEGTAPYAKAKAAHAIMATMGSTITIIIRRAKADID